MDLDIAEERGIVTDEIVSKSEYEIEIDSPWPRRERRKPPRRELASEPETPRSFERHTADTPEHRRQSTVVPSGDPAHPENMSRRRRREPAAHAPLPAESRRDPLARWRFRHRGTTIDFVPSGITVDAATPAEMVAAVDEDIVRRVMSEPET